jgi:hypothetical protein
MTGHAAERAESRFNVSTKAEIQRIKESCFDDSQYKLVKEKPDGSEIREIMINGVAAHAVVKPDRHVIITLTPATSIINENINTTELSNKRIIDELEIKVALQQEQINILFSDLDKLKIPVSDKIKKWLFTKFKKYGKKLA